MSYLSARYSEPLFCEALLAADISDGMWDYVVSRFSIDEGDADAPSGLAGRFRQLPSGSFIIPSNLWKRWLA